MKTEDIRKMGAAYLQVQEANKVESANPEDLEELNKATLGSYVKKASGSAAGISAVVTAQSMSSKGKADPDDKRQLRNRMKGISQATDRLTKESGDWPVFNRIQEKALETKKAKYEISNVGDDFATDIKQSLAKHTKGATEPERMHHKLTASDKKFVDVHGQLHGQDSGISADKTADQNVTAVRNSTSVAPKRHNDQTIGDKTMPKPKG